MDSENQTRPASLLKSASFSHTTTAAKNVDTAATNTGLKSIMGRKTQTQRVALGNISNRIAIGHGTESKGIKPVSGSLVTGHSHIRTNNGLASSGQLRSTALPSSRSFSHSQSLPFAIHVDSVSASESLKRKADSALETVNHVGVNITIDDDSEMVDDDCHHTVKVHHDDCETMAASDSESEALNRAFIVEPLTVPTPQPFTHSNASRPSNAHLSATDYHTEILTHLLKRESELAVDAFYLSRQPDLNGKMREILVDWLHDVVCKFQLSHETMHLCVSIIDRFLSHCNVSRKRLQLVGCVSLLLACKYEECLVPEIEDFVHISDRAYSKTEMIECERAILNTLKFSLTVPTSLRFNEFLLYALTHTSNHVPTGTVCKESLQRIKILNAYMLQLTLQSYRFLQYKNSTLAAAAFMLSVNAVLPTRVAEARQWCHSLMGVTDDELHQCAAAMFDSWRAMFIDEGTTVAGSDSTTVTGTKYRAVKRKFSKERFGCVSLMELKPVIIIAKHQ